MPGVKFVNAVVELFCIVALQVEIAAGFPAQVRVAVLVGEAHGAAAAGSRGQQADKDNFHNRYQKLSTVM